MFARPEPSPPRRRLADRPDPRPWLLLYAVALAIRLVPVLLARGGAPAPRWPWQPIAESLARDGGFAIAGAGGAHVPTAAVAPVVPWIASGVLRIAGDSGTLGVAIAIAAIAALAPLLASALGGAVFGGNVARAAGWICAIDPLLTLAAPAIEAVAATALMVAVVATAAWVKTPRPGRAVGVGMLWGAGVLTHPALLALPPLIAVWAWIPLGLTVAPSDRVRQVVLLLVGLILVVVPWSIRNALTFGSLAPVTTESAAAFHEANESGAWRIEVIAHGALPPARPAGQALGTTPVPGARAAPAEAVPRRALAFLAPSHRWLAVTMAGVIVLALALWGTVRALSGPRRWFQSLAVLPILAFAGLALAYGGGVAARVPAEPLFAVLAAVAVADLNRRFRARSRGFTVIEGGR